MPAVLVGKWLRPLFLSAVVAFSQTAAASAVAFTPSPALLALCESLLVAADTESGSSTFNPAALVDASYIQKLADNGITLIGTRFRGPEGDLIYIDWEKGAEAHPNLNSERGVFLQFALSRSKDVPGAAVIENLTLQDPLAKDKATRHPGTQAARGISPELFKTLTVSVKELCRQLGYSQILSVGQSNYLVLKLYQRILGMKPADEASRKTIEMLDRYYAWARANLADYGLKSLDHFTALTGMAHNPRPRPWQDWVWKHYRMTGFLPNPAVILKDDAGEPFAVLFRRVANPAMFSFIDTEAPEQPLLDWDNLAKGHRIKLVMPLNSL